MNSSNAQPGATNLRQAGGEQRVHLATLDAAVTASPLLAGGIVAREGVPVLYVICSADPTRMTEVGCELADGDWWYTWSKSGERIGPVKDPQRVADNLAGVLTASRKRGL